MKKKFNNLSIDNINEFISQSRNLEKHFTVNMDEKSNMDFKNIINRELKDKTSKVIEMVDTNFDVKLFIDKLKKL